MIRIEADVLIPGRGQPVVDGAVVIEGASIAYAGPVGSAPPGGDTLRVPAVMPGMWDCHVHFAGINVPDIEVDAKEPDALKAARSVRDLSVVLDAGFTSVREPGGLGVYLNRAVNEGAARGPEIYAAGSVLSTTGGHADVHAYPLGWFLNPPGQPFGELCDGVPEVLKGVRKQLRKGARVIKFCASGGVMSELDHPIHQQFSLEEMTVIVEEAARAERVVAAHCHGKPGIMAAITAGVRTIEHGSYLDEEAADAMLEADAILVPTRHVIDNLLARKDVMPPYAYEKLVMVAGRHLEALQLAIAKGVTIALGTDTFVSGAHGANSLEVRHLIEAGMEPLAAIEAATANGPLTVGPQAALTGQLAEGYDADVIAFDANPLEDSAVWGEPSRVTHVWKAGTPVKAPSSA
jgi:imidazolonepropionase-like amidohydrolase